jgi:hypothetical protein
LERHPTGVKYKKMSAISQFINSNSTISFAYTLTGILRLRWAGIEGA